MSTEEFVFLLMYLLESGGKFEFEIEFKLNLGWIGRFLKCFLKNQNKFKLVPAPLCCGKASHKKEKQSSVFCKVYHKDPDLVSGCQYFEMPIWQFSEY